jgi:sodium--glutamate symport carrier gltS
MNLQGIMELTMACATAGLVIGAVLGGPLAEYLLKRHKLEGPPPGVDADGKVDAVEDDPVTAQSLLNTLFVILLCLAGGKMLVGLVAGTRFILPDFVCSLLLGVVIRNASTATGVFRMSNNTVDVIGNVALSMFLVMALMYRAVRSGKHFAHRLGTRHRGVAQLTATPAGPRPAEGDYGPRSYGAGPRLGATLGQSPDLRSQMRRL